MAPINKKFRAVIDKNNSDAENSNNNIHVRSSPAIVTTAASNVTAVITTAFSSSSSSSSSVLRNGQSSNSSNAGLSDSDQTEGNSSQSGTPQDDEPNSLRNRDYPNLSFVGHTRRSTSILSPLSVTSQYDRLLHTISHRPETRNVNFGINQQCIVPSPAISPFDSHSQPCSYSASSSSSSLSPSPSTSTQDKYPQSLDSPSNIFLYDNGTRRKSVISGGDRSPNTFRKETHDESSNEQQHAFDLHIRNSRKTTDGSSTSGQSGKITLDKSSEEYRLRRERNNIAVRKSRSKSKIKFQQTIDRVHQLEEENAKLHHHIAEMSQELAVFKILVEKYQIENCKRIMKSNNDVMEIPPEIRMIDRVEIGGDRFQIRNFSNSRRNNNPFYHER